MTIKNLTEKVLLDNVTREPIVPEKQTCELDEYYESVIGTREIWGENGIEQVPNDIYWGYAWRYGKDDCRTAKLCNRDNANCIVINTFERLYFLELDKEV